MTFETGLIHSDAQPIGTFNPNVAARYKKARSVETEKYVQWSVMKKLFTWPDKILLVVHRLKRLQWRIQTFR